MPKYSEESIRSAINDVENGISQRKAAQRWKIPRTTLQERLNGRTTRKESHEFCQRLSEQQESHLAQWILAQANLGFAPTHKQVKEFATTIIRSGGDDQPLGKRWMEGFIRRNPEVRTVRGKSIDSCRLNRATTKIIKGFFQIYGLPSQERNHIQILTNKMKRVTCHDNLKMKNIFTFGC
jgi:4-hydroxybenzoate polyprenyltransferase